MKLHRRHRIAGRRLAGAFLFRPLALAASIVLPLVVSTASLEAASPIENSVGNLNAHLQVHSAAVGQANSPAQTGGAHTHNQVLNFARALLNLRLDLQVPYDPAGDNTPGIPNGAGGLGGGYGGDLTTDLFVQQQVSIDNWAPGGPNNSFNDRGTLIAQDGSVVITPTSSYQIGNFNLQTAAINGRYTYVNDLDAAHGAGVHSPFDITSSSSGSADTTTDTSEVRVDLQWVGTYDHPANAYDAPQGGGYPAPIGALDFFTFDIVGNAAAQYFNPTGLGGSNQQPGLPDLPDLPPLPDFGDQPLPNELTGLNPYAPPRTNNGNDPYNPYNPQRYTDPNYNPYNPTSYTDPNYNPYNPTSYNGNNPYLASNPYNARGAPDNSALLAALGGSASNVNNQSQFDLSWMTEIEQSQGVQHYQDYGSFSSANSAAFRGIVRPLQLTAVNQQDLAAYIAATGNTPSTIATQINVLDSTPGGVTSFASLDDYDERRSGNTPPAPSQQNTNPFGYNTYAGNNQGSNASRVASYQGTGTTPAEFGGAPTTNPLGYDTDPLFAANNPGGNRIGSFGTANSYDDNTQGNLLSGASGYQSPAGDVLSYGGATGYDGYDSSAAREQKQAEIDAARDEERRQVVEIEEQEQLQKDLEAMESLTLQAIELAKRDTSSAETPTEERKPTNTKIVEVEPGVYKTVQDDPIEEVAPGQYADKEEYDPAFDVPDEIEEKYREQQERLAQSDQSTDEEPGVDESVKDGGYQFDDPYQDPNASEDQSTPREKLLDYYGDEIAASGWEKYLDTPATEFASLPPEVRNSDEFQKWMLYEYVLKNPDASPAQIGGLYRAIAGVQYESDFVDTWLYKTAVDAKENGVAWDAAWKGVKGSVSDIHDQLESLTVVGQGKQIIDQAKLVMMPEDERKKYLDSVFAPYQKTLELLSLDSEERNQEIDRLLNVLKQDIIQNPEKYTELGVRTGLTTIFDLVSGAAVNKYVDTQSASGSRTTQQTDGPSTTNPKPDSADPAPDSNLAGSGAYGDVYRREGGIVEKVMKNTDYDSAVADANRQMEGKNLLESKGIAHTEIYEVSKDPDSGSVVMKMQDALTYGGEGSGAYVGRSGGIDALTDAEFDAYTNLIRDIDNKGLVWGDAKPANVFFYKENGVLKAGVLDHDLIVTKSQFSDLAKQGVSGPQGQLYAQINVNGLLNSVGDVRVTQRVFSEARKNLTADGRSLSDLSPNEVFLESARILRDASN